MPEIKANEALPERPAIVVIFGDAGIGKTSLSNTCANPYTIDFDKGLSRASSRGDALLPDNWEEVLEHEKKGTFKKYSTLCIDTAKACLDDYLMSYVVKQDYKNQKNKQAAYGAIGDQFKLFVSNRRQDLADLFIIAHSKDKEDGDLTKKIPDVTGQSYQLLLRIADQIGYYTTRNNKRVIQWDPTDFSVGKNVARLPVIEVPEDTDPRYKTFMADIFALVKASIVKESEAQRQAAILSETYQKEIAACDSPDRLTELLTEAKALPDGLKVPLTHLIAAKAKEKGYIPNKTTLRYELPAAQLPAAGAAADTASASHEEIATTPYDDRCKALAELGMTMEIDQAQGFGLAFSYDEIGDWTEEQYMANLGRIHDAAKPKKPQGRQRPTTLSKAR
jgi:AAA domain